MNVSVNAAENSSLRQDSFGLYSDAQKCVKNLTRKFARENFYLADTHSVDDKERHFYFDSIKENINEYFDTLWCTKSFY